VNPVDHAAAAEAGGAEDPVGQVARGAAEHGGEAHRGHPAARVQRQPGGEGGDRERGHGDQDRVTRCDAAGGPGVADQPDGGPSGHAALGRAGVEHQGLAHLVGGEHREGDRGHRPPHPPRQPDRGVRRDKRHEPTISRRLSA
jgi:hypothetical protein